jgi:hypothetical protein
MVPSFLKFQRAIHAAINRYNNVGTPGTFARYVKEYRGTTETPTADFGQKRELHNHFLFWFYSIKFST